MTIEEIALICELQNYSSFLDASYYLPYSPSAITKYVNNVEQEFGIKLFNRSNKAKGLSMTKEGQEVIGILSKMNDDYDFLKKRISIIKGQDSSRINIGSQPKFANIHEQRILTSFLFENPTAQVNMIKSAADDLIRSLVSGKLDVAFITLHDSIELDKYFGEKLSKLELNYIITETEMYAGVSEKYFKDRKSISLIDLKDFTLAWPFPNSNDIQSAHAAESWKEICAAKGFVPKYINLQGLDLAVFEMARQQKLAVTATQIPSAKHEGIRFLRIDDWSGKTNLYLLKLKENESTLLNNIKILATEYNKSNDIYWDVY